MTTAVMTAFETRRTLRKPSPATLARIETVLTLTLVAQTVGLFVRYAL